MEEKTQCAPGGWRRLERQGFVLGRSWDHLLSEATLEEGVERDTVYAWNQSPRLWLLVFRDKLILLIW